jgi:hypothetical protein
MTLPDAVRIVLGDGALFDDPVTPTRVNPLDLLADADRLAADVLARVGVLYVDDEQDETSTDAAVEQLAGDYAGAYEPAAILTALEQAGRVPWDETGPEYVIDLVQWYAEPHKRAAYYLGLAIGWRAAQQFGGDR